MPEIDINAMTDAEFVEYINNLEAQEGEVTPPQEVAGEPEPPQIPDTAPQPAGASSEPEPPAPAIQTDTYEQGVADGRNARLLSHIRGLYPDLDEGDAVEKFLYDADLSAAEAAGVSIDDYRRDKQEQADFAEFKAEREKKKQDDETSNAIIERWKSDTERMKAILPDFDFDKAMESGQFRDKVLNEGKDIITAYFELNPINKAPEGPSRRDIEVGDMPGGLSGGFKSPFDVKNASKEEFDKYVSRILENE